MSIYLCFRAIIFPFSIRYLYSCVRVVYGSVTPKVLAKIVNVIYFEVWMILALGYTVHQRVTGAPNLVFNILVRYKV